MKENQVKDLTGNTMEKIKCMVDANTIIGERIEIGEGAFIIPVSKISYGFAAGGSDFASKKAESKDLFGGGSGAGINITPIAFISVNKDGVKLLQIESFEGALDRIIATAPDLIDKISKVIKNRFGKKDKN